MASLDLGGRKRSSRIMHVELESGDPGIYKSVVRSYKEGKAMDIFVLK